METSTHKPFICYHRRSKNKNGANPSCFSKSAISSQNGDGAPSDQRRIGLFKAPSKPVICFHRRGNSNTTSSSKSASHINRDAEATLMGGKRKRMSVQLPDDIIQNEILTRLPAKYFMRSRLVCKSWNSLLVNSAFLKSHLARMHSYPYKDDDEDLIIAKDDEVYHSKLYFLSRTNQNPFNVVPPFYGLLLGSINGLVCMSSRMGTMFRFWNPANAQLKQFFLPSQHPKKCRHLLGGFCWDHMQNDYKLALVCHDLLTFSPRQLMIYSSNSATWTQLPMSHTVLPNGHVYGSWFVEHPAAFVNGIPYWKYSHYSCLPGKKRRRRFTSVFKFLPENNEFRLLPDLDLVMLCGKKKFNISVIKGGLVGMAYKTGCAHSLVDIYSLDEETHSGVWSKMYTIGPIDLSVNTWKLSQCFNNGGEILIHRYYSLASLYDPKTKQTKALEGKNDLLYRLSRCYSYTPSLVSVQGMVSIQQFLKNRDNVLSIDDLKAFNYASYF